MDNNRVYDEIWLDVKGYEGLYQVSNLGQVKSVSRYVTRGCASWLTKDVLLKPLNQGCYDCVNLFDMYNGEKRCKREYIHRIVASAFITNPSNKEQVDHINGNKRDNRAVNLRWCNKSENINNPNTKYNSKKICKVQAIKDGKIIGEYKSMSDASRYLNIPISSISCIANGKSGMNGKKIGLTFKKTI